MRTASGVAHSLVKTMQMQSLRDPIERNPQWWAARSLAKNNTTQQIRQSAKMQTVAGVAHSLVKNNANAKPQRPNRTFP